MSMSVRNPYALREPKVNEHVLKTKEVQMKPSKFYRESSPGDGLENEANELEQTE